MVLVVCSLVRNSVVLAVYLLFSVVCFFTVHEHYVTVHSLENTGENTPLFLFQTVLLYIPSEAP
ncbi:hypothetical protein DW958_21715 [Ruminococcus sp. AM46-18]|nr:hypothetical protein DW958_21715 [Ruminococcus sp. AM46-18]